MRIGKVCSEHPELKGERTDNSECPLCRRTRATKYMRKWRASLKRRAHEKLGGKCLWCGFTDERALQIDHVHGDGAKERSMPGNYDSIYLRVLRDRGNRYQLLCANCNWIKRFEAGEWPRPLEMT